MSEHPYNELDTDEALEALLEHAHRFDLRYFPPASYAPDGTYRAERQHRKGGRLTIGDAATIREAILNCYAAVAEKGQFA